MVLWRWVNKSVVLVVFWRPVFLALGGVNYQALFSFLFYFVSFLSLFFFGLLIFFVPDLFFVLFYFSPPLSLLDILSLPRSKSLLSPPR